ncbi:hypothetical protein BG015_001044 [Linnemannia schmuckeri]|uniref:Uncharacterized protein n=1 Tax=Linnemannia schmuckeri TaxID=64567 RepID=A0A9P5RQG8_9FUNG|nr:hypothetical protein BG015_001044 [Linnemannia schmuckeri]
MNSDIRYDTFLEDAPKPTVRSLTPTDPRALIVSTLQLVFCARLLLEEQSSSSSQSSAIGVRLPDDPGRLWLDAIREDPTAQARIRWLVSKLVAEFLKDPSLGSTAISEVVILGPVLCQADYRALLSCFIERFDQSALLNQRRSPGDNNDGSRGDKSGSNKVDDGPRRRKDDARSKRKGNSSKSRPSTSSNPFSKRNLFKEPAVLQFLVERTQPDSRLKKRLFSTIEQSKAPFSPSLAAANAITILFKSGEQL